MITPVKGFSPKGRRYRSFRRELLFDPGVLLLFTDMEDPGNVEAPSDIPITPRTGGLMEETMFVHTCGIGEVELEHVTAGIDVDPDRQGIVHAIEFVGLCKIFYVDAHPFADPLACQQAKGELIGRTAIQEQ